jgi:glycosyltransferase involved in cell wall biosynthesis
LATPSEATTGEGRTEPAGEVLPLLSVLIETLNEEMGAGEVRLGNVLEGLKEQTYPQEKMEILVVLGGSSAGLAAYLTERYPYVKQLPFDGTAYFPMKNHALQYAEGDIIAFLDSDCIPSSGWAASIVNVISAGADVSAGRTRYPPGAPLGRTFGVFDFGHVEGNDSGEASGFLAGNCAFRRDVILQNPYDKRIRRSGGCYLLARQLRSKNYKLRYNAEQFVVHGYNVREQGYLRKRLRSGYDTILLSRIDEHGVLPEGRFLRFGLLAPFLSSASRLLYDFRRIVYNRRDLEIPLYVIPYFYLVAILMRSAEIAGGLVTVVRPDYLKKKYDW